MSHDHDHDGHPHHHDHVHGHDHTHGHLEMTFDEKIVKLLDHWIKHNEDHAVTYQGWADQAKMNHLDDVAAVIEDAAEMNRTMNEKFAQAKSRIQSR